MVRHDEFDVRIRRDVAYKGRDASSGIRIGRVVDLEIVDRHARVFEGIDHALGPLATASLRQETPDHGLIASPKPKATDCLGPRA